MAPKPIGTLVVVVLKARNLPDKHTVWKQDPYVVVKLGPTTRQTEIDKRGGQHPVWDAELRFPVYEQTKPEDKVLRVSVFSQETRGDELLGESELEIADTLTKGEFDEWVTLYTSKGDDHGQVYLEMTYYVNAPAPLSRRPTKMPQHERLSRPPQKQQTAPQQPPHQAAQQHEQSPPRTPPKTPPKSIPNHTPHSSQSFATANGMLSAILERDREDAASPAPPPKNQPQPSQGPAPLPSTLKPGAAALPASLRPRVSSFQAGLAPGPATGQSGGAPPGPISMPIHSASTAPNPSLYGVPVAPSSPPASRLAYSPPRGQAPALPPHSSPTSGTTASLHPRHPSIGAPNPYANAGVAPGPGPTSPPPLPSSLMPHHPPQTQFGSISGIAYESPYPPTTIGSASSSYPGGPSTTGAGPSFPAPYHSPYEDDPIAGRGHTPGLPPPANHSHTTHAPYPPPSSSSFSPFTSTPPYPPSNHHRSSFHGAPAPTPPSDPAHSSYLLTRYATPLPLPLGNTALPDPFSQAQQQATQRADIERRQAEEERARTLKSSQEEADAELARVLAQNEGIDIGALRLEEERASRRAEEEERDREVARRLEVELNAGNVNGGAPHMPGQW